MMRAFAAMILIALLPAPHSRTAPIQLPHLRLRTYTPALFTAFLTLIWASLVATGTSYGRQPWWT